VTRAKEPCRVYWGSHGCVSWRGHPGKCRCDCCLCPAEVAHEPECVAYPPYYGLETRFYGEDVQARGLCPQ